MTPEQFSYWLQGKLEGRDYNEITQAEHVAIQEHLDTVFQKVTPVQGPSTKFTLADLGYAWDPASGRARLLC